MLVQATARVRFLVMPDAFVALCLTSDVRCEVPMPKSKHQIDVEVAKRGLVSIMNDTKWRELQNAVRSELPFAPTYQLKAVFNPDAQPEQFEPGVNCLGDWSDVPRAHHAR